jgi:hypothetical protein
MIGLPMVDLLESCKKIAWRITGLYCSASGYDRNWTMFECVSAPTTINKTQACDFLAIPVGTAVYWQSLFLFAF